MAERVLETTAAAALHTTSTNGRERTQAKNGYNKYTRGELFPLTPSREKFLQSKAEISRDLLRSHPIEYVWDFQGVIRDFGCGVVEKRNLRRDPVYEGIGVPHGDGKPVIVMGGLISSPVHYWDTVKSLRNSGYDAKVYPYVLNVMPPTQMARELMPYLRREAKASGRKVAVVGHSLGSYDWGATFAQNPEEFVEYVDDVVFDESPRPYRINKAIEVAYLMASWPFEDEDFELGDKAELLKELEGSHQIKFMSVDSSRDPIIPDGQYFGLSQDHFVIDGMSHCGGASSPEFVKLLTYHLADVPVDFKRLPHVHQETELPQAA